MIEPPTEPARRVSIQSLANVIGYAIRILVTFAITPQLVRGLGDERYGVWSLAESVLAYLSLFDFGISASVLRYGARFHAIRDWSSLNRTVSTSFCVCVATGLAVLTVGTFVAFVGLPAFNVPSALRDDLRFLVLLLSVNLAIRLPLSVFAVLIDSLGRYTLKVLIRTSFGLASSLSLVLAVRAGHGLQAVGLIITAFGVAENLTFAIVSRRLIPTLRFTITLINKASLQLISGYSGWAFVALIAGRIGFQTDALVIGWHLAPQYIAFFAIATRLVEYSKDATRSFSIPVTPAISAAEARGESQSVRFLFLRATRMCLWLILPAQVGLITLGRPFLSLWLGDNYAKLVPPMLTVLAAPVAFASAQNVAARALYGIGRLRLYALAGLTEALTNLILSLILIGPLGILGVALGTAIPSALGSIAIVAYTCRVLHIPLWTYFRSAFVRPILVGIVLYFGWSTWSLAVDEFSWLSLAAVGVVGTLAFALLAVAIELGPLQAVSRVATGFKQSVLLRRFTARKQSIREEDEIRVAL